MTKEFLIAKSQRHSNVAPFLSLCYWDFLRHWTFVIRISLLLSLIAVTASGIDGPLTPEQSLQYLKTEPGLKVELVASEPMVVSPVAVAWDERGRMFVVEDRGYPTGPPKGQPPAGQVVLLEDTNGDGKYDKRTVFVDGLTFPNGVMPWSGGVYVTCAPYLYYFKDTDGDGKADIKQIVFKGFQDLSTTQLRVSHPTLNIDNWVYLTSGLTAAKVISPAHSNRPPVFLNRVDGRFRPGTDEIEPTAGTAQFGQTFDAFGRKFICSNRNHIQQVVMQFPYLKRNPNLGFSEVVEDIPDHDAASRVYPLSANITTAAFHTGFFTSACGLMIYQGTALPQDYLGNSFTCEPAGNLVHRDVLVRTGVTCVASRAYPTNEFLASPDNWFRPVNLANGPDGALYVCDMYRKTIEHPEYLPEATRKVTDFESGKGMGRIYRVVAESPKSKVQSPKSKVSARFDLNKMNVKQLVAELNNTNIWWRMTAQRLLLERRDNKAVPFLEALAERGKFAVIRVHALRTLEGMGALTESEILGAMADQHPAVRENGIQMAESWLAAAPAENSSLDKESGVSQVRDSSRLATRLLTLYDDPDARVRFQCALALGALNDPQVITALVSIASRDVANKWTRAAILSAITHREDQFLHQTLPFAAGSDAEGLPELMGELGHILALASPPEKLPSLLQQLVSAGNASSLGWQMAAVGGFGEGLRARESNTKEPSALLALCPDSSGPREQLDVLFKRANDLTLDGQAPLARRLSAIRLLNQSDYASAGPTLQKLLDPQQPAEIQSAAIRALGHMPNTEIGPALVKRDRWNAYTPAVRDVVLSAIMTSTNLVQALLTGIEAGDVPAWTVNADRRNLLMKNKDDSIRTRATTLFKDLTPGDRMKVYEEYKSVLGLKPDPKNGHAVFQKNCITCHVFAGEGKTVGPDLTGIRNQPAEVILLHIVVPEYEIMPIYTCYNVETREGQGFTGLLAAETPNSITLRMAQGLEQQIPRANISSMATSRLSLMPQELEKTMSKQDLADLVGFLKGQ